MTERGPAQAGKGFSHRREATGPVEAGPLQMVRGLRNHRGPAPVHLWDPPFCGDIDLRIARDGVWHHEGRPIRRQAMVNLFASILKREGDAYFLVNPVEKVRIQVEDCPFLAVDMEIIDPGPGQKVVFLTNVGETVTAGAEHPIRVTGGDEPHPTVHVRAGLDALLSRAVFYRLVSAAGQHNENGAIITGIRSQGSYFQLGAVAADPPEGSGAESGADSG